MSRIVPLILCLIPAVAGAQFPGVIGDRVRVNAPESGYDELIGLVVKSDSSRMLLTVAGQRGVFIVHRIDIQSMDISSAQHRHTLGGAVVGLLNGTMFGLGWAGLRADNIGPGSETTSRATPSAGMIAGGVAGMAIGAVFGFLHRTDDWAKVPMPQ